MYEVLFCLEMFQHRYQSVVWSVVQGRACCFFSWNFSGACCESIHHAMLSTTMDLLSRRLSQTYDLH